jgi:3-hydroxybutyryl-CoA dehydrogenase
MNALPYQTGVIGGGRMGSGIVHALLTSGSAVTLVEANLQAATSASERVMKSVQDSEKRGLLVEPVSVILERFKVSSAIESLEDCELVIEAVPEIQDLKYEIFRELEKVTAPTAVLATNTSSLSVNGIAASIQNSERVVGLHFFNPVPASQLIEVVLAEQSAPDMEERARSWVAAMGKTPVVIKDSPGFATSRLGLALGLEAIRMVEDGVASPADIDLALELGYKHPIGPLRLTDIIGLDVRLDIARYLESTLGPRFAPPALMIAMVEDGRLGRKVGQGFYSWDN